MTSTPERGLLSLSVTRPVKAIPRGRVIVTPLFRSPLATRTAFVFPDGNPFFDLTRRETHLRHSKHDRRIIWVQLLRVLCILCCLTILFQQKPSIDAKNKRRLLCLIISVGARQI